MDYLNFNNQARTIAREVSLANTSEERKDVIEKYNGYTDDAGIYKVSINITTDEEDVTVEVFFERGDSFLIMPEKFAIVYKMRLESTT